jgi:peptidoglycan/xylan/chitin deacetylase (PgdA/CDA1 family)
MSAWIGNFKSDNLSMISRGEFGGVVGLPRILDLLKKRGIGATFCVPGYTAYAYPTLVKYIHEQGHELVHHGWVRENRKLPEKDSNLRLLIQSQSCCRYTIRWCARRCSSS